MYVMWEVLFQMWKSVQILTISLMGLKPMLYAYASVDVMAQSLNVRQHKLGNIIMQTVLILKNYFQFQYN
jgi:hypothetical protein